MLIHVLIILGCVGAIIISQYCADQPTEEALENTFMVMIQKELSSIMDDDESKD